MARLPRTRGAFTLIELLVVVAILALLASFAIWVQQESDIDILKRSGEQVASAYSQARLLAMRTGAMHGVTIHIENAGDGSVLWNHHPEDPPDFLGRHWLAIIGPSKDQGQRGSTPPMVRSSTNQGGNVSKDSLEYPTVLLYKDAMRRSMIDNPIYLPQGVRFLALSDKDRGRNDSTRHPSYVRSDGSVGRPWHGLFDPDSNRVLAWGAYNRDFEDGKARTAFRYEGMDSNDRIPYDKAQHCNVHPAEVWGQIGPSGTAREPAGVGDYIDPAGRGSEAYSLRWGIGLRGEDLYDNKLDVRRQGPDKTELPGTPRPMVDGLLGDAFLVFESNGKCLYATGNARRRFYLNSGEGYYSRRTASLAGLGAREFLIDVGSIFAHNVKKTGGYYISLCRDIDPDDRVGDRQIYDWDVLNPLTDEPYYDRLTSVDDYLRTITPYLRVYVPRYAGDAEVLSMDHPDLRLETEDLLK